MHRNIEDYVLTAKSVIPEKLCKDMIKEINKNKKKWFTHIWTNDTGKPVESINKNKELDNLYLKTENSKKITSLLWNVIQAYQKKLNYPWFKSWSAYTDVRFNIYKKNKQMSPHCDHIHSIFDGKNKGVPILSLLGVLNDNYQGGKFVMFENMEFEIKQGDVLIFPSNFLYPHKVEPVTKGTRYSFISWVW